MPQRRGWRESVEDIAGVVGVLEDFDSFSCECYGDLYGAGPMGIEDCLSEVGVHSDAEEACLAAVFEAHPAELEVALCLAEQLRGAVSCVREDGCPATFTCDDGVKIPERLVCDRQPDCEDGSDEQGCPVASCARIRPRSSTLGRSATAGRTALEERMRLTVPLRSCAAMGASFSLAAYVMATSIARTGPTSVTAPRPAGTDTRRRTVPS